ncbi:Protein of unknown function (DUF1759) [Popillia japonica]|uniref:Uncharacterized protein n=1 Tax=Popillia japonica TaxID=7064 RepID=A0AAW1IWP4_POPJA
MTDLTTFIKQRGVLKAQLTSFAKFVNVLDNPSKVQKINIKKRLVKIEMIIETFEEIQNKIDLLEPDQCKNTQERENFETDYYQILSIATNMLENDLEEIVHSENNSIILGSIASNASHVSQQNAVVNVKLPKIELPQFDGDYTSWQQFYDGFLAMIHNNNSLSNVQKLCYLKSQLRGEPANMLSSLKTIDSNYETAFNALCKRYNKKRLIIDNHVRKILMLEPIASYTKDSHIKLRNFINHLENNMR